MPTGTRLSSMELDEVSFVTRGANQHAKIVLFKSGEDSPDYELEYIVKRNFTKDRREKLASQGKAMPGGKFPIENEEDLKNAIKLAGKAKDPAKARSHIKRRAKALGKEDLIPDSWVSKNAQRGYGSDRHSHRGMKNGETCPKCNKKVRKSDDRPTIAQETIDYYLEKADREEDEVPKLIDAIDMDELDEDVQKAIAELNSDNTELAKTARDAIAKAEEAEKQLAEIDNEVEEEEEDEEDDEDDVEDETDENGKPVKKSKPQKIDLSKLDPEVRNLIKKSQDDAEEAQRIAKVERDSRLDREFISKADTSWSALMFPKDHVTSIREMAESNPEAWAEVEKVLNSANEIAKSSPLFKEVGAGGVDVNGTDAEGIIAKVDKLVENTIAKGDGKLTKEQAMVEVLNANPDLYNEYHKAKTAASKVA